LGAAQMLQDLLALPVMNVGPATFACGERAGRQEREEFSHSLTVHLVRHFDTPCHDMVDSRFA